MLVANISPYTRKYSNPTLNRSASVEDRLAEALVYQKNAELYQQNNLTDELEQELQAAIKIYQELDEQGVPEAQYQLGLIYKEGKIAPKDWAKAVGYFEKAAKHPQFSSSGLLHQIGLIYDQGPQEIQDKKKAASYYECATQKEFNPDALYQLGYLYELGQGVDQDLSKAQSCYQQAADLGNIHAMHRLGEMYLHGTGVACDQKKAIAVLLQAAQQGNSGAVQTLDEFSDKVISGRWREPVDREVIRTLQNLFLLGSVIPENEEKAYQLLKIAAKQGCTEALTKVGERAMQNAEYLTALDSFTEVIQKGGNAAHWCDIVKIYNESVDNPLTSATPVTLHPTDYSINHSLQTSEPTAEDQLVQALLHQNYAQRYQQNNLADKQKQENDAAIVIYQKLANENNPQALYQLGMVWLEGKGVKQKPLKAFFYFKQLVDQHKDKADSNTCYILGQLYESMPGAFQDKKKAEEFFWRAVNLGNLNAMYRLGRLYVSGEGVKKNLPQAIKLYQYAADQGNSDALCEMGRRYYAGEDVPQSKQKAVRCYQQAAEFNHVDAMLSLGLLYESGQDVPQDRLKAIELYRRAAVLGNITAIEQLKQMSASPFEEQALRQAMSGALYNVGMLYQEGVVVKQDLSLAADCFQQALNQNALNADAMFQRGLMLWFGQGVEQDRKQAVDWYQKAADLGNAGAMLALLNSYKASFSEGQKVNDQAQQKLATFSEQVVKRGNTAAMVLIGTLYEKGQGAPQDLKKAIALYEQAAIRGNKEAVNKLNQISEAMTALPGRGVEKELVLMLEKMYRRGFGGDTDSVIARELFQLALKNDWIEGKALNERGERYVQGKEHNLALEKFVQAAHMDSDGGWNNLIKNYRDLLKIEPGQERMYQLGLRYFMGEDVPQNFVMAAAYFAQARDSNAIFLRGLLYEFGKGVKRDEQKAQAFYQLAMNRGNRHAILHLGSINRRIGEDQAATLQALKANAATGNVGALYKLGEFYIECKEYVPALAVLVKAANGGSVEACNKLAEIYSKGIGALKPDHKRALSWLQSAQKLGDSNAAACIKKLQQQMEADRKNKAAKV